MSMHINKFIDRIKANESRGQRDFTMSMTEAKDLHADITKLLLSLQVLLEERQSANTGDTQVIDLQVNGGSF
jgi:hypothetical protein